MDHPLRRRRRGQNGTAKATSPIARRLRPSPSYTSDGSRSGRVFVPLP